MKSGEGMREMREVRGPPAATLRRKKNKTQGGDQFRMFFVVSASPVSDSSAINGSLDDL
jgi:hypothetical protein